MRLGRSTTLTSFLLWFGVAVPPLAWTAQLVVGYGANEADCSVGSGSFNGAHGVAVWLSVGAGVLALLSLAAATLMWWETRDRKPDLRDRIPFMATIGVLTGLIFLALIVITAVGITHFDPCRAG